MRFIKHPTFDFADNLNSPPSIKDNKTKKNIISAFYVEGGMPIINPEREFLKYQKPLPYDKFTKIYANDEEIKVLFDYKLEDESIDSFWGSPCGDKLLTINTLFQ
jgi:hypothetical protein